jgi:DNA-binding SARP family transcriptional activator
LADAPFVHAEAVCLEAARLTATEDRISADLSCGRHRAVAAETDGLTREHPLREHLFGLRMLALYRDGRQSEALGAFHDLREALTQAGLEPGAAIRDLQTAILRHDSGLDLPGRPARATDLDCPRCWRRPPTSGSSAARSRWTRSNAR